MDQKLKNMNYMPAGYKYYKNIVLDESAMDLANKLLGVTYEIWCKYPKKFDKHIRYQQYNTMMFKCELKILLTLYTVAFKKFYAVYDLESMTQASLNQDRKGSL